MGGVPENGESEIHLQLLPQQDRLYPKGELPVPVFAAVRGQSVLAPESQDLAAL